MSKLTTTEQVMAEIIAYVPPAQTLSPGPGPGAPGSQAALRRCCAAWRRAFRAYMETTETDDSVDKFLATRQAGTAYCNAMPVLDGYQGVRDFLACMAHGILIGAIPKEVSGQLLYAAQVALNTLPFQPKQPQTSV
jgi:hypothetical protein